MAELENKQDPESNEIAHDIARLYSWAKVEDAPYRTFSRERTVQKSPLKELPPQIPSFSEPSIPPAVDVTAPVLSSPTLAIDSLAGGVGKTTISANLARILCSLGERVLLVDASGSGLLPFYFGATDLRPGLRTFVAPETNYPPMHVIGAEDITSDWLEGDVKLCDMQGVQRTIFDLGPDSKTLLPAILEMCGALLFLILSDLNSA